MAYACVNKSPLRWDSELLKSNGNFRWTLIGLARTFKMHWWWCVYAQLPGGGQECAPAFTWCICQPTIFNGGNVVDNSRWNTTCITLWKEGFSILSSVIEVIQPLEFTWSPYYDTRLTQSYFIFCVDSQDLGYNIDIKLCLGAWLRVAHNVNFWPSTFWPRVVTP